MFGHGRSIVRRCFGALCPLAALCAAGCAGGARTADAETPSPGVRPEPVEQLVVGGDNGLELRWWLAPDLEPAFAALLGPHELAPISAFEALRDQWRESGLRIVAVPIEECLIIQREMPPAGRINRHWLGQSPTWFEAVRGPSWGDVRALRAGGESIRLDAGRLRLILRSWTAPTPRGPRVRVEIAVQHVPTRSGEEPAAPFMPPLRLPAELEGIMLSALTARLELDPAFAYFIVSERPDVEWDSTGSAADERAMEHIIHGPRTPPPLTVGEALLSRRTGPNDAQGVRAVIMLLARTPEAYRLLP